MIWSSSARRVLSQQQQFGERIPGPALVTGGNGYVASWLVRRLLELGFDVRATVRDPSDPRKTEHLLAMAEEFPGTLSLFRADLMESGGFDRAMAGCALVFHTASPVVVRGVEDPVRELIEPATRGTRNVLEAANRTPSVRRVVLTSSVSAIYEDAVDMRRIEAGRFDESHWNETSSERHHPYSYAKTEAERLAWRIAGKQDRWDLVVVNPGLVLGPSLSPHSGPESVQLMREIGNGDLRLGVANFEFGIVDVRDVAEAHLRAALIPEANGRHILVSETMSLPEVVRVLRSHFGGRFPFPRYTVPRLVAALFSPLRGVPRRLVWRNAGHPLRFDNRYAKSDLGMSFRPAAESIVEHFQQLLDDGLVGRVKRGR